MVYNQQTKYIKEIEKLFDIIGSKFHLQKKHQQFLFWFMWFNFKWEGGLSEKPPQAVLYYLCDNKNDQSIDAFYFDDDSHKVYLIQSKYTANWTSPSKISYSELKRTADIIRYFENPSNESVVYRKASNKCKQLLDKAYSKIRDEGYERIVIFVSNKLKPDSSDLDKLKQLTEIDLEDNFKIFDREKLIGLYVEFLAGHNPPIPPYFLKTVDDEYLYISEPKHGIEAYIAIVPGDEFIKLYNKFGVRIFEKNIRGFLGRKEINKKIDESLREMPELFFYKNSGITILGNRVKAVPGKEGQEPGFTIEDIQIINGQQTVRVLAQRKHTTAKVLVTILAPCEGYIQTYQTNVEKGMTTDIIAARNFQNKIGYSDLKSNHPKQVELWRLLKEKGYYYERKRNGWRDLDYYARSIYSLACSKEWARIKKEQLAAVALSVIKDPQLPYEGADYIFKDMYKKIFPEKLYPIDWYLALYLLWKRYVYPVCKDFKDTYPQYHILKMLSKFLRLNVKNATKFSKALEREELYNSLINATKKLYKLCSLVVKKLQKEEGRELGTNDVFGKRKNILTEMSNIFNSRKFSRERKLFLGYVEKFKKEL